MGGAARSRPRGGLSGLLAVWLGGLATGGLAYLIVEGAGEEASLLEQGVAVALLAAPFFLVIHTLLTLWPLIRGHVKGLAAVWGAGAAGLGLVSLTDGGAGPGMSSIVLLCRLLALLGPGLLSLVTAAWLLDRWRRGPA